MEGRSTLSSSARIRGGRRPRRRWFYSDAACWPRPLDGGDLPVASPPYQRAAEKDESTRFSDARFILTSAQWRLSCGGETLIEVLRALGLSEKKGVAVAVNGSPVVPRIALVQTRALAASADRVLLIQATQGADRDGTRFIPWRFPLMAITQNGVGMGHSEQAARLCAAGVRWIQLRMKDAPHAAWLETASEVAATCRAHGTVCIIRPTASKIALAVGADGVHLGRTDLDWRGEARRRLGAGADPWAEPLNYTWEAGRKALRSGCLDYVGVAPSDSRGRKSELAPLQGYMTASALIACDIKRHSRLGNRRDRSRRRRPIARLGGGGNGGVFRACCDGTIDAKTCGHSSRLGRFPPADMGQANGWADLSSALCGRAADESGDSAGARPTARPATAARERIRF